MRDDHIDRLFYGVCIVCGETRTAKKKSEGNVKNGWQVVYTLECKNDPAHRQDPSQPADPNR